MDWIVVVSVSPHPSFCHYLPTKTSPPQPNMPVISKFNHRSHKVDNQIARPLSTIATIATMSSKDPSKTSKDKDKSKVHKLSLKGSSKLVAEFVRCFPPPPRRESSREANQQPWHDSSNTRSTRFCTTRNPPLLRTNGELTRPLSQVPARRLPCRGLHSVRIRPAPPRHHCHALSNNADTQGEEVWPQHARYGNESQHTQYRNCGEGDAQTKAKVADTVCGSQSRPMTRSRPT
jgi:hypothetical protein